MIDYSSFDILLSAVQYAKYVFLDFYSTGTYPSIYSNIPHVL